MNIENLAIKLKQSNLNINLNEESLNYPILKFKVRDKEFKFFYRENFIKRSKFHKKYNTYFEIEVLDKSDISLLKSKIETVLNSKYCVDNNKIYSNITKFEVPEIISFINEINRI